MGKKTCSLLTTVVLFALLFSVVDADAKHYPPPRTLAPIVSTEWLATNLDNVVVVDIRDGGEYGMGHIPGAINEPLADPFSSRWVTVRDGLIIEVPGLSDLFDTIGSLGIQEDSRVVIVTSPPAPPAPPYSLANATRVADTLIYAGVANVAILDGGHTKWVSEGRPVTGVEPTVTPVVYIGHVKTGMFVPLEYVHRHMDSAVILDARDPDVYFGITLEVFAEKAGHIPGARSLPTPWMWTRVNGAYDGTYLDTKILRKMASGVIEKQKGKEIIVYCGVGGYASSWWYVLTQVLDYRNAKIYDGSAQEWVLYYDMVPYQWD